MALDYATPLATARISAGHAWEVAPHIDQIHIGPITDWCGRVAATMTELRHHLAIVGIEPVDVVARLGRDGQCHVEDDADLRVALQVERARRQAAEADASNERHLREAAERQAFTDPLTGLPNRRWLDARWRPDGVTGLLLMDLDEFKAINDTLGHDAGDEILCVVAARASDVRGCHRVVRLGGDEFALLATGDPMRVARDVLTAIRMRVTLTCGTEVIPRVSIGVAADPDGVHSLEVLRRVADCGMYRAKALRRRGLGDAPADGWTVVPPAGGGRRSTRDAPV